MRRGITFWSRCLSAPYGPGFNLASHVAKLEEAGYLRVEKRFRGKKPQTTLSLTASGRAALTAYREGILQALSGVVD